MPEHQQVPQSKESKPAFQKQAASIIKSPVFNSASIIQLARNNPKSLTPVDVLQLQRTIGNRAVGRLLSSMRTPTMTQQVPIQRQEIPEEEEPLQGVFERKNENETCPTCMQRQEIPEEEELIQGKMIGAVQRQKILEEEEPLQTKRENNTGLPDNLKAGVESLSGIDMSDVRVHYNSEKPAEVGALAYTQGTNIHVAPGQERHLPHEAWHVVQQVQGRVRPTFLMKEVSVNDDVGLEREADVMGNLAVTRYGYEHAQKTSDTRDLTLGFTSHLKQGTLESTYGNANLQIVQRWPRYEIFNIPGVNIKCHDAVFYWILRESGRSPDNAKKIIITALNIYKSSSNYIVKALGYYSGEQVNGRQDVHNINVGDILFTSDPSFPMHSMVCDTPGTAQGYNNGGTFGTVFDTFQSGLNLFDRLPGQTLWHGNQFGIAGGAPLFKVRFSDAFGLAYNFALAMVQEYKSYY
jgi:hypothetical protein